MLYQRILSALVLFALITISIIIGPKSFFLFVTMLSVLAIIEFNNFLPDKFGKNKWLLVFLTLFMQLYIYLNNILNYNLPLGLLAIFIFITLFIFQITTSEFHNIIYNFGVNLLALLYIGAGMSIFMLLRNLSIPGLFQTSAVWLVLIATWATDIGAFFIGKYFGQKPLAPKISPNKTIEGAIGGIIFNLVAILIFINIFDFFAFHWIIYAIFSSIAAIIGDLFESSLKRDMDIKDSGDIMPGHGGVLDRFDSIIFSSVFTYYYLLLLL